MLCDVVTTWGQREHGLFAFVLHVLLSDVIWEMMLIDQASTTSSVAVLASSYMVLFLRSLTSRLLTLALNMRASMKAVGGISDKCFTARIRQ
jgi:hypothetical protein